MGRPAPARESYLDIGASMLRRAAQAILSGLRVLPRMPISRERARVFLPARA